MTTCIEEALRPEAYDLLGVQLHAVSSRELIGVIEKTIENGKKCIIANHNLHSVYLFHHHESMRRFHQIAEYTHIDGMALVFLGWLFGLPFRRRHRTTFIDLVPPLFDLAAQRGWRVFYIGSRVGVAEKGAAMFRERYPRLEIQTSNGYFDASRESPENRARLTDIESYRPDILLVGMGMPRQEAWILDNLDQIRARVILCAGACMDYFASEIPIPPRWMGAIGLEWAYRLLSEPKRLWRRYLLEPFFILALLCRRLRKP